MLSVRGEGILSWVGDDNFVVEDKTTAFQEVPPPPPNYQMAYLCMNSLGCFSLLVFFLLSRKSFKDSFVSIMAMHVSNCYLEES